MDFPAIEHDLSLQRDDGRNSTCISSAELGAANANEAWFSAHYPQVMAGGDDRIYAVRAKSGR